MEYYDLALNDLSLIRHLRKSRETFIRLTYNKNIQEKVEVGRLRRAGVERYILVEQKKYQKNNPFLKVGPKGSLTFGVKAELKVARDQVKFEAKGAVEVAIKGDGTYNFSTNTLVVEGYFPPAILFVNIQIGTKGFIEFELVDFQKSVELTDKIPLYDISYKF